MEKILIGAAVYLAVLTGVAVLIGRFYHATDDELKAMVRDKSTER